MNKKSGTLTDSLRAGFHLWTNRDARGVLVGRNYCCCCIPGGVLTVYVMEGGGGGEEVTDFWGG